MVYKYIRGIKFVCHDENILGNFCVQINSLSQALAASYDTLLSILDHTFTEDRPQVDSETKKGFTQLYNSILKFGLKKTPSTLKALDDMQNKRSSLTNLERQQEEEFNELQSDGGMLNNLNGELQEIKEVGAES